ncbi:50S ribosomal protein L31 [Candidatus Phytoplasma luffae]|uniref:50S ribosomal protein L31 n=1 Tax=Loofah witches'-broom phytoplasma TaxID=35773 RepID=A0A975FKP7_LOWBP|nr:50S ribosomal protein L31 [Candidatus Phytoplasma luffae]QTX03223.1 50S ribosomal protein L31 [Candidatus Phytoplasma luffae]
MKKKIKQPELHNVEVTCFTCNSKHKIWTTVKKIKIEICSQCNSFYTGKQLFVTVAGQIDKFYKRYGNENKEQEIENKELKEEKK